MLHNSVTRAGIYHKIKIKGGDGGFQEDESNIKEP